MTLILGNDPAIIMSINAYQRGILSVSSRVPWNCPMALRATLVNARPGKKIYITDCYIKQIVEQ